MANHCRGGGKPREKITQSAGKVSQVVRIPASVNSDFPRFMPTVEPAEPSAWSAWTSTTIRNSATVDGATRAVTSPAPNGPSAWMPLENMPPVQQPLGAATSIQPPAAATKPKGSSTHVAPAAAARARAGAPERSHAPLREQRATTASINCVTGSLLSLALAQQVDGP